MRKEETLDNYLLPLRPFPKTMVCYSREDVKIMRPEDLEEFDYINSLTQDSEIDFSKLRVQSSDLDWTGVDYLLPIAQRRFLSSKDDEYLQDFFENLIWVLHYDNGMKKLISLFSEQDIICFKSWFLLMLNDPYMSRLFSWDREDIMKHIAFLDDYISS